MSLTIYEIVYETPTGLSKDVVTGYSEEDVVERFNGGVVKIESRGPYLGEGPFEELRNELMKENTGLVVSEEVA